MLHCGAPGSLNIDKAKPNPSEDRPANEFELPKKKQLTDPPPTLPPAEGETDETDDTGKSKPKEKMFAFVPGFVHGPVWAALERPRRVTPILMVPRPPGGAAAAYFRDLSATRSTPRRWPWGSDEPPFIR